jgi:hypothetical protein
VNFLIDEYLHTSRRTAVGKVKVSNQPVNTAVALSQSRTPGAIAQSTFIIRRLQLEAR